MSMENKSDNSIDILEALQARFRTPESITPGKNGRFAVPSIIPVNRPDYQLAALRHEDERLKGEFVTAIFNPNTTITER